MPDLQGAGADFGRTCFRAEVQGFAGVRVDFDSQKDVLRRFGVQRQSTLIVFKGATEMGRSVGDTGKTSIEALLAKGL